MATIKYKPTTPARRHVAAPSFEEVTKRTPEKNLTCILKANAGRNSYGKITVRHRGNRCKRMYRIIDYRRLSTNPAKVVGIEYDPNRTAYIALIEYDGGERAYIIAPDGLKAGDTIYCGAGADIKTGNCLPVANIPVGTMIYNIELYPGKGGQLVRSAGSAAQLMAKENGMAQIRLPSGEVRMIRLDCKATIGIVGNIEHETVKIGKAGTVRHMGIRPHVRGAAMNPNDHPHGGGEGKCPVGHPSPMTPWGKRSRGNKTRDTKAKTNKFIVKRRNG